MGFPDHIERTVEIAHPPERVLAALATAEELGTRFGAADHPAGYRQHLALLADAGLVTSEHGERRRVRYRLRSAPMRLAQQFPAALAHDWDDRHEALAKHLDRHLTKATDSAHGRTVR